METEEILAAIQQAANTIATPNWADKLSVVISLLTVVVAGFVAWKQNAIAKKQNEISIKQAEISENQNRIALFTKRYEVYEIAKKIVDMADKLSCIKQVDAHRVCSVAHMYFGEWPEARSVDHPYFPYSFFNVINRLDQTEFLFSNDVFKEVLRLKVKCHILYYSIDLNLSNGNREIENDLREFCQCAKDFSSQGILKEIESDLQLQSIKIRE